MEAKSVTPISHLERLPHELTRAILIDVSDLASLHCAILSCRVFLNSFNAEPSTIATRVLFNDLDAYDVRPEAIAALQAGGMAEPTRLSAQQFFKAHLRDRNAQGGIRLTLDQVTRLSRQHLAASSLADDFIKATFKIWPPRSKTSTPTTTPSSPSFKY